MINNQASESPYLPYVDLCLARDDLFEIPKKKFNELFGIEPPEKEPREARTT